MKNEIPFSVFTGLWPNRAMFIYGKYEQYGLEGFLPLLETEERNKFLDKLKEFFESKDS